METVLKLQIAELDVILLNAIKKAFGKDHNIEISIKKEKVKNDILKPETKRRVLCPVKKSY